MHLCFWTVVLGVHAYENLHNVETSIPVPLKHILEQKFTTKLLVQTLGKIYQLPKGTEASVRELNDTRIIEQIPGLQDIRKKTLPQMYFEDCSMLRETYYSTASSYVLACQISKNI